jgi:hypothetical protein
LSRRFILPVVLVAISFAVVACGGSSALSTSQYESKGAAALTPLLNALNGLKGNPSNAAGWTTVQVASQGASATFAKLQPPSNLSNLNSQLAGSLSGMGAAAGKLSTDITKRSISAAQSDLAGYKSALLKYAGAINQLAAKGVKFVGS